MALATVPAGTCKAFLQREFEYAAVRKDDSYIELYLNNKDGIRHGDGDTKLMCRKYLLNIFKVSDRRNYYILELLRMLYSYFFFHRFTKREEPTTVEPVCECAWYVRS